MSLLRGALRGVHPVLINVAPSLHVESALCASQLSGSVCGALRVRPVRCCEGRARGAKAPGLGLTAVWAFARFAWRLRARAALIYAALWCSVIVHAAGGLCVRVLWR